MMKKLVLGSVALALASVATAEHDRPIYRRIQQSKTSKKGADDPPPPPSRTQRTAPNNEDGTKKGDKAGRTQGTERAGHTSTQRTAPDTQVGTKKAKAAGAQATGRTGHAKTTGNAKTTGRTGRPERGGHTEEFTTRMKTEPTGRNAPDNTGRSPSDDWYDDFFVYYDDQYPADAQVDDASMQDDWYDDFFVYYDDQYPDVPLDDAYTQDDQYAQAMGDDQYYDDQYMGIDDQYMGMDDQYNGMDDQYYVGGPGGTYDDYYYPSAKSSKSCKGSKSKKGSKKCSKKGSPKKGSKKGAPKGDDDIFYADDFFVPGAPARPTLSLTGEAVSPPALLAVVPNPAQPDPLSVGTIYPFNNYTYSPSYTDVVDFYLEGELIPLTVRLDGYCTRIGTSDATVIGYCHFTYTAEDPQAFANIGEFVVEGTLSNPSMSNSNPCGGLQVTGGTGIFTASYGIVAFCPATLNQRYSPPLIESLPPGEDVFQDAQAYLHLIDMSLDAEFVYSSSA